MTTALQYFYYPVIIIHRRILDHIFPFPLRSRIRTRMPSVRSSSVCAALTLGSTQRARCCSSCGFCSGTLMLKLRSSSCSTDIFLRTASSAIFGILRCIKQRQQRPRLAESQPPFLQILHYRSRQPQQPHVVRYRFARHSHPLPDLLLRQSEFPAQFGERRRLLHAVQVLALQVFDDRHLRRLLIGDLAHNRRESSSSPPAWKRGIAARPAPAQYRPSAPGRTTIGCTTPLTRSIPPALATPLHQSAAASDKDCARYGPTEFEARIAARAWRSR